MKYGLLQTYKLEKRIALLERSMGRSGAPTNAKVVWQWLVDNGPATQAQIKAALPDNKYSGTPALNLFTSNNLITQNGNTYSANLDYNWDDVGVIPHSMPSAAELRDAIANGEIPSEDEIAALEEPARRGRARAPRGPKANIWSKSIDEVREAIRQHVDVNQTDDKGVTPLGKAVFSRDVNLEIVNTLLNAGANPNVQAGRRNEFLIVGMARDKQLEIVKTLRDHGATASISAFIDEYKNELKGYLKYFVTPSNVAGNVCQDIYRLMSNLKRSIEANDVVANLLSRLPGASSLDENSLGTLSWAASYQLEGRTARHEIFDYFVRENIFPTAAFAEYSARDYGEDHCYMILSYVERALKANNQYVTKRVNHDWLLAYANIANIKNPREYATRLLSGKLIETMTETQFTQYVRQAVKDGNEKNLTEAAAAKYSKFACKFIDFFSMGQHCRSNRNVTRLLCKVIKSINKLYGIWLSLYEVRNTNNPYLLEWSLNFSDVAKETLFEDLRKHPDSFEELRANYPELVRIITEAGYTYNKESGDNNYSKRLVNAVVSSIESDSIDRTTQNGINVSPEILNDDAVVAALNAAAIDNVTANHLKRQRDSYLASVPKSKYDF